MHDKLGQLFERVCRSQYYEYTEYSVEVRGLRLQAVAKMGLPGWPAGEAAALLMAETAEVQPRAHVAVIGCGNGLLPAAAARLAGEGQTWALDTDVLALEAARLARELNGVPNLEVVPWDGTPVLDEGSCDVALVLLPKGRDVVELALLEARRLLREGGVAYLAGANRAGIKGYGRALGMIFGEEKVVTYRRGQRLLRASKRAPVPPVAAPQRRELSIQVRGCEFRAISEPGTFSHQELDPGTAALLGALRIRAGDRVLDLGCGCGIVGLVAAGLAPRGEVWLVDASLMAVRSARETLALNGVSNARVEASDVISAVRGQEFDVVATNPPFHAGLEAELAMALAFIVGSRAVLRNRGRLFLVANRFIKYEPYLEALFASVRAVYEDSRYKVLEAAR